MADANDRRTAGGKAYALAKMIQAGFNVPRGFVISSACPAMTPELQKNILNHFYDLHAKFVAVRSSAVNEDGQAAAWAGQLDTFLNTSENNLVHHIELCWKSTHSPRAQSYAVQKNVESGKVGVIVQKMIQSEVSGVAFSVHPVSQDTTKIIIEAGLGLGEAIVSGEITPDAYTVHKSDDTIIDKRLAPQTKKLVINTLGETVWEGLGTGMSLQKLSDRHIVQLSAIVRQLEVFFSYPVDVEWALCHNKLYVLQCRPITGLRLGDVK